MKAYRFSNIFLALIISQLVLSCGSKNIYEEYIEFENLSWNRFNILKFEINVGDNEPVYDIFLTVRHLPEIPYKELKINMTIYSPSGEMRSADYPLKLKDQDGNSMSKCLGDLCDIKLPIRKEFKFSESGISRIEIENKFTKVDMPGIMEVGLIVRKAN